MTCSTSAASPPPTGYVMSSTSPAPALPAILVGSSRNSGDAGPGACYQLTPRRLQTARRRAFSAHPRCSDSPPRSKRKAAPAARVSIWPTAAPLVRNSPRGWAPKTLPDPEVRAGRADEAKPPRLLACRLGRTVNLSALVTIVFARRRIGGRSKSRNVRNSTTAVTDGFGGHPHANGSPSGRPYRRERPWCPPSMRVPDKWSGRRPTGTWAAVAAFRYETRRTV
jgi:hypothetical protein